MNNKTNDPIITAAAIVAIPTIVAVDSEMVSRGGGGVGDEVDDLVPPSLGCTVTVI